MRLSPQVGDVAALLECLELEGSANRNFEFCAALLQVGPWRTMGFVPLLQLLPLRC